jgi:hypothetical protein
VHDNFIDHCWYSGQDIHVGRSQRAGSEEQADRSALIEAWQLLDLYVSEPVLLFKFNRLGEVDVA